MTERVPHPSDERIVDTMIDLACVAKSHRVIVAGSSAFALYLSLLNRGFSRVATATSSRFPCGQRDVALVAGRHSMRTLEALLLRVVSSLNTRATMAVWVDADAPQRGRNVQSLLERLGFRIEAGAGCGNGFVLAAQRHESGHIANVAQGQQRLGPAINQMR
jgi:hypothetical protein